ncbi:methyltransferase-related [Holotrichia oblita]|uniref:Methyltransferase-related n=1 Tax=Holotrichia oblita TaxID=644536 RepID=A0ACB9SWH5_HOLOL|nr:methyltransferase-related [Holotrichia oblita]
MDLLTVNEKNLTPEERDALQSQNTRLVTQFQAESLEKNARKHWDLFYKRNEDKFFRDRHWTTREFNELLDENNCENTNRIKTLLEIGCGVGNLIFPLIEENANLFVIACDLSPRAVEIVKNHKLYNEDRMKVFVTDITMDDIFMKVDLNSVDIVTMVFVISAIHPDKFVTTLKNVFKLLRPGGVLLFRDYGLYDMAQLRFKAGHKISENFYMRQDGTR